MKSKIAAVVVLCGVCHAAASGQAPGSDATLAAIRTESQRSADLSEVFHTLTDVIGPRLTGSPAHVAAARWAADRLQKWGLADVHLEPWEFGRGWAVEKVTLDMTAPRYMSLTGYPEAWSPGTAGLVSGTPVYLGDSTLEDVDKLGARLKGAIVLVARPQTEFLNADRPQPADATGSLTGNPPYPSPTSRTPPNQLLPRLRTLGAAAVLRPASTEHGTVRVQGAQNTAPDAVPMVTMAAEQYNTLVRMVQAGAPVMLRVEVGVRFYPDDRNSYNVLAEIPGADAALRDQIVLVGAHLDSWHTATGATDNADGATTVMEVMRILKTIGARPRRTIRMVLWSGEEEGLLGARAYVAQHLKDAVSRNKIAVYLNDDPGTGKTYGFYMQNNEAAKRIFDGWLEPLKSLGAKRNVIEAINATDHVPFDEVGIPAFTVIKDFRNYDTRTRHTNADLADAVNVGDLKQAAVVMATFAWQASMRDAVIPRKP
jgi:carboxypeptidase Q